MSVWREALDELGRRKLRTGLTLLGLIFGVGSIVAMLGVGEGSRQEALSLVEGLGLRNLIVRALPQDSEALREVRLRSLGLTRADAEAALAVVPGAEAIAAEKEIRAHQVYSDQGSGDVQASAVSANYFDLASLKVDQGRALDNADEEALAAVAVLGYQAARSLFPRGDAVGQWVKINHAWFEVVGVLADRDLAKDQFEGVQLGLEANRVFVPLASARERLRFQPMEDEIDRFWLRVADPEQIVGGAQVMAALLDQRHGGIADYSLIVPAQLYRQHQQTQRIFRFVMAAIAGVSLLVGGIGIMNIMLVSVTERTREIGIRQSVGATPNDIRLQFLSEALMLSLVGGLIGVAAGVGGSFLFGATSDMRTVIVPSSIVLAFGSAAAVGIFFGFFPANKAAQLDPIEALRHE